MTEIVDTASATAPAATDLILGRRVDSSGVAGILDAWTASQLASVINPTVAASNAVKDISYDSAHNGITVTYIDDTTLEIDMSARFRPACPPSVEILLEAWSLDDVNGTLPRASDATRSSYAMAAALCARMAADWQKYVRMSIGIAYADAVNDMDVYWGGVTELGAQMAMKNTIRVEIPIASREMELMRVEFDNDPDAATNTGGTITAYRLSTSEGIPNLGSANPNPMGPDGTLRLYVQTC